MERRRFVKTSALLSWIIAFPKLIFAKPYQSLPNLLILGDSISIGYTPFVKEMLTGKANVYRPTLENGEPENCEGTTKGVQNMERWITAAGVETPMSIGAGSRWDIIHFNFGLHDIKHIDPKSGKNSNNPKDPQQADLKQYKKNLEIIVEKLKNTGATLIFATTTPYPDNVGNPLRKPGMSVKYNKCAVKIMNKNEIFVNDLYAFMLPRLKELQLPQNVHFKPEGYHALAGKVTERVKEVIRDLNSK